MSATYLGRPCAKGHAGVRLLSNRKCVECNRADRRAQYAEHGDAENAHAEAKLSLLAIYYEQEFDHAGWHRAGRATVEY